jgi:predicted Zn-dependent protease with MMP-like domain
VPRTAWGASGAPVANKITISRTPLLRRNRTPEALAAAVQGVVFHEIAHHFGISDARLRELEAGA